MTNQEYEKKLQELQAEVEKLQELQTEIDELKANKPTEYKRWRAREDDEYSFLSSAGFIGCSTEQIDTINNYQYSTGNYFFTKKEAEQHKAYLLALQTIKDDAEGWIPDWRSDKYHGYYDHEANELNIGWSLAFQYQGVVYFKSEEAIKASQKEHRKEWLTVLGVEQ